MRKSSRRKRSAAPSEDRAPRPPSANGPLVRNLLIIAALIVVIALLAKEYRRTLATRAIERQRQSASTATPAPAASPPAPLPAPAAPTPQPVTTSPPAAPTPPPETQALPAPPPSTPAPSPPPADTPSPAQSLVRLRESLAAGKRDEMPVGTIRRGDSDFFAVTTPMTWQQAHGLAEAYGGHLPLAGDPATTGWLAERLAEAAATDHERSALWIGARSHGGKWHGIDGAPLSPAPAGDGDFAALGADGVLRARDANQRHTFFLQWRRDGSNPASLRAVLARTKASLESGAPSYPPDTVADGDRRLLVVAKSVNATEARELAELAGGHLMVPATPAEADWLAGKITTGFPQGLWLGARRHDDEWNWDSGEAWTFARWDPARPPGSDSALVHLPGAGWRSADPAAPASGFIIEWSRDAASAASTPPVDRTAELLEKSRPPLAAAAARRDAQLKANARTFAWDLDVWLRTNNKGEIDRWRPRIEALKTRVQGNRVPTELPEHPNRAMSERMLKIARDCRDKQKAIDAEFLAQAARIRDAYAARLRELAAAEDQRGQPDLARRHAAAAAATADLQAWLSGIGAP
jgi:hypothetical protein